MSTAQARKRADGRGSDQRDVDPPASLADALNPELIRWLGTPTPTRADLADAADGLANRLAQFTPSEAGVHRMRPWRDEAMAVQLAAYMHSERDGDDAASIIALTRAILLDRWDAETCKALRATAEKIRSSPREVQADDECLPMVRESEAVVLEVLANSPMRLSRTKVHVAAGNCGFNCGENTVKAALFELEKMKLLDREKGKRSGYGITNLGHKVVVRLKNQRSKVTPK